MRYSFELVYELDCTVGEAVAAYLDAEHYMFLHKTYVPRYCALWQHGTKMAIEQSWKRGPITAGMSCTTEYIPPARFLNYDIKPIPRWIPSIHHLVQTATDLRYYASEDGLRTVNHLKIELELFWFIWPFRKVIEAHLKRLKIEKDQEDVEMITRPKRYLAAVICGIICERMSSCCTRTNS